MNKYYEYIYSIMFDIIDHAIIALEFLIISFMMMKCIKDAPHYNQDVLNAHYTDMFLSMFICMWIVHVCSMFIGHQILFIFEISS